MSGLKITVAAPTYNRYKDLENLIESFLLQDYENAELLIIDDLGSPKIGEVTKKWMKKSKRILYYKNPRNLGVVVNIRKSFEIAKGDIVVFMGDDDLFIDGQALSFLAKAFLNPKVGVAKASQILFKNGEINQAFPLKNRIDEIIYHEGRDIFENIWFETISFTGLAFRNNLKIRKLISDSPTLFPQVELAGLVGLFYKVAEINRHLVGVQSYSSGQLNPVYYFIDGVRTNILEDWMHMFRRIKQVAKSNNKAFINESRFIEKFSYFTLFLLPYNTLTNGRIDTLMFILNILKYTKKTLCSPFFWISASLSTLFPKAIISASLEFIKSVRIRRQLNVDEIRKYNSILKKFYPSKNI